MFFPTREEQDLLVKKYTYSYSLFSVGCYSFVQCIYICEKAQLAGIAPDAAHASGDQGNCMVGRAEQEKKSVKESLVSAYDINIATRLKAEMCSVDVSVNNFGRETSIHSRKWSKFSISILPHTLLYLHAYCICQI